MAGRGYPEGTKIDGGLEARHFLGDSAAVGLVTRLGPIDVVLEPRGFEAGYFALIDGPTTVRRGDVEIRVGALVDVEGATRRAKDIEHLAALYKQYPDLAPGPSPSLPTPMTGTRVQDPAPILVTGLVPRPVAPRCARRSTGCTHR